MVPTQESPRASFSCPRWAWRGQSGTDGAAEWKYVPPHSKNEIQSRSQPVSFLATIECLYLKVLANRGDRQHRRGVEHDLFGIAPAITQYCEHPLAGAQTRHSIAGFDHLARGFEARREREWRLHLIGPADHQAIREIDPGGSPPDADLAGAQRARWDVLQLQHVGGTPCTTHHRPHPPLPRSRC